MSTHVQTRFLDARLTEDHRHKAMTMLPEIDATLEILHIFAVMGFPNTGVKVTPKGSGHGLTQGKGYTLREGKGFP